MAFITQMDPASAYHTAKAQAVQAKTKAQARASQFAQATTPRHNVFVTVQDFSNIRAKMIEARDTPGLDQYAKDQRNNPAYDVVAEINLVVSAIEGFLDLAVTSFPDALLSVIGDNAADYATTHRAFNAAQLATAVVELNNIDAAIEWPDGTT